MEEMSIDEKMEVIKKANEVRCNYEQTELLLANLNRAWRVQDIALQNPNTAGSRDFPVPVFLQNDLKLNLMAFLENKMSEQLEQLKNFRIELVRGEEC